MTTKTKKKKPNMQDSTLINIRALKKRLNKEVALIWGRIAESEASIWGALNLLDEKFSTKRSKKK